MNEVRPEAVRELVELMSDTAFSEDMRIELFMASQTSVAEKLVAFAEITGLTATSAPTVLDMTLRELQAYAAIWGVLHHWWVDSRGYWTNPPELDRTLESAMKIIPTDDAKMIERLLKWSRLS